ncbi:hypothetical protein CRENPOLYSF2_960004 [Crenothrix polyspora]|uniref:Uncharacterized protein n=1 Tax=Crenothrix polyspora TaxID=360316 RepID=A0A1R4HJ74_9GAMM|nr:hypothetical protein [Crenothrix polyspora]SJM96284.1 hypothetical protein CRENPOLYSF2_960004 [Crenothrix polyspora]
MESNLLIMGVGCVVAAIIGGGFRFFGMDVPLINSIKRQMLLGLFGLVLISPTVNPNGLTHFKCDRYARVAIEQHKKNLKLGCNLVGIRWHDNFEGHYNWCLSQSNGISKYEMDLRKSKLDDCAKSVKI